MTLHVDCKNLSEEISLFFPYANDNNPSISHIYRDHSFSNNRITRLKIFQNCVSCNYEREPETVRVDYASSTPDIFIISIWMCNDCGHKFDSLRSRMQSSNRTYDIFKSVVLKHLDPSHPLHNSKM